MQYYITNRYIGMQVLGSSNRVVLWQVAIANAGPTSALQSKGGKLIFLHHFVNIAPLQTVNKDLL